MLDKLQDILDAAAKRLPGDWVLDVSSRKFRFGPDRVPILYWYAPPVFASQKVWSGTDPADMVTAIDRFIIAEQERAAVSEARSPPPEALAATLGLTP